jgi:hypothetical protein
MECVWHGVRGGQGHWSTPDRAQDVYFREPTLLGNIQKGRADVPIGDLGLKPSCGERKAAGGEPHALLPRPQVWAGRPGPFSCYHSGRRPPPLPSSCSISVFSWMGLLKRRQGAPVLLQDRQIVQWAPGFPGLEEEPPL